MVIIRCSFMIFMSASLRRFRLPRLFRLDVAGIADHLFEDGDDLGTLCVHGGELALGLDKTGIDEKFDPIQRLASLRKRDGVLGDVVAPREGIASLREVCADGRTATQKLCGKHRLLLLPQIATQFNNVQGEDSRLRLECFGSFSCHYLIAFLLDVLPCTSDCWRRVRQR